MTEQELQDLSLKIAAGSFLTDDIPEGFWDWDDDRQTDWTDEHVWEPFENYDAATVWSLITDHTMAIRQAFIPYVMEKTNERHS